MLLKGTSKTGSMHTISYNLMRGTHVTDIQPNLISEMLHCETPIVNSQITTPN